MAPRQKQVSWYERTTNTAYSVYDLFSTIRNNKNKNEHSLEPTGRSLGTVFENSVVSEGDQGTSRKSSQEYLFIKLQPQLTTDIIM